MQISRPEPRRIAACAALSTGAVHAWLAPEHLKEIPLFGALFLVAACLCADVAMRLWRSDDLQAWLVGTTVCTAMAVGYVLSRTVGLFSMHEGWDGLGVLCLLVDGTFLAAAVGRLPAQRPRLLGTLTATSVLVAGLISPAPALAWGSGGGGGLNSGCTTEFAVPLPTPPCCHPPAPTRRPTTTRSMSRQRTCR